MNTIEKARQQRQVGDVNPKNPNEVWTEFKPGQFYWRSKKVYEKIHGKSNAGGGGNPQPQQPSQPQGQAGGATQQTQPKAPQAQPQPSNAGQQKPAQNKTPLTGAKLLDWAESADVNELKQKVENAGRRELRMVAYLELKRRGEDVTKLKTDGMKLPAKDYKKAPKSYIDIPEEYKITGNNGQIKPQKRDKVIEIYGKLDDKKLLSILNNTHNNAYSRQIAYEEATSRGLDEDKMDTSGGLESLWRKIDKLNSQRNSSKDDDEEEEIEGVGVSYDAPLLENFDEEAFRDEFPGGDTGWTDKNDSRVQKQFNGFKTLVDRQRYDQLLNKWKRESPDYQTAFEVIEDLNTDYLSFVTTNASPMFVSAGGAGAGKTYGFDVITEELNIKELGEDDDPQNSDWGFVKLSNPKSAKDFTEMLEKYNGTYWDDDLKDNMGHILVFDDNDAILTRKEFQPILKNILDTNPKNRNFTGPDGKIHKFTGKILVITNKSMDTLTDDEDKKAVMSRAEKSDVQFTVDENLDLLRKRYKTMGIEGLRMDEDQEEKAREDVYNFIMDNKDKLDPAKFTVRKFGEVIKEIQKDILRQSYGAKSPRLASLTGKGRGWEAKALKVLNKAEDDDLNNEVEDGEEEREGKKKLAPATQRAMNLIKKRNPDKFKELFGEKAMSVLNKDDNDEKEENDEPNEDTEKALLDDMSLEDAENLLFG